MNRAIIFAGGTGSRMQMKENIPKQFLKIKRKPIIIYTLEVFENNEQIDDIIVVCIKSWVSKLKRMIEKYNISKVSKILEGGATGFESRIIGLEYVYNTSNLPESDIVLFHDAVRPFINSEVINNNIENTKKYGNAITTAPLSETPLYKEDDLKIMERDKCYLGRAPQTFYVKDIMDLHNLARKEGNTKFNDCASLAYYYNKKLYCVEGPQENIKITTIIDYFSARGLIEYSEKKK